MNDMDQDECDETICSDVDDRASETDSKKDGSRGTSRGSSNEGKSQGNSSKPRRWVLQDSLNKITLTFAYPILYHKLLWIEKAKPIFN